jgi:hypothetical protein
MCEACSINSVPRYAYKITVWKYEYQRPLGHLDRKMLIKLNLKEWGVDWLHLPHNRVQ